MRHYRQDYYALNWEGIIPAIETAHALAYLEYMQFDKNDNVVICISGRGDKDLDTYIKYFGY